MATPLPRPHRAFSLKVGVGARDCDSYDTKRTEFEPMSTIATGSPGNRPRALSGVADRVGTVSSITNPVERLVSPGRASIRGAAAAPSERSPSTLCRGRKDSDWS